jgi:hypothetical protein
VQTVEPAANYEPVEIPGNDFRLRASVIALTLCTTLAAAGHAHGQTAEVSLAELYAPIVRLVEQPEECGPGEPYKPIDIDAILDEETVSLRGPWRSNDLVEIGPSADDLGRGLFEYNIDFPGEALRPGCNYERWGRRLAEDTEPTVYAHLTPSPRIRTGSRSSTGSSTSTTTGTTCTRATGG